MCCGSKRAAARAAVTTAGSPQASAVVPASASSVIVFEYIGPAAPATVPGPASGRVYRFQRRGDRQAIDARDRPGLAAMPSLRWVR